MSAFDPASAKPCPTFFSTSLRSPSSTPSLRARSPVENSVQRASLGRLDTNVQTDSNAWVRKTRAAPALVSSTR